MWNLVTGVGGFIGIVLVGSSLGGLSIDKVRASATASLRSLSQPTHLFSTKVPSYAQRISQTFEMIRRFPRRLSVPSSELQQRLSATVLAHRGFGLRHDSRVDLILNGADAFVLDVKAAPELMEAGLGSVAGAHDETFCEVVLVRARAALR